MRIAAEMLMICDQSRHDKTAVLARKLLNAWNAFGVVLEYPELPLANNDTEQGLRHWVIAWLISLVGWAWPHHAHVGKRYGRLPTLHTAIGSKSLVGWAWPHHAHVGKRYGRLPTLHTAIGSKSATSSWLYEWFFRSCFAEGGC